MSKKQDFYYWRLIATGLSFTLFGIGGLTLWLIVFPIIGFIPYSDRNRSKLSRSIIHHCFKFFIGIMHRIGIYTYSIKGLEQLNQPGQLIIANHPTLIDIVFLISLVKDATCIVKESLTRNPSMRGAILNADYIPNDSASAMTERCVNALHQKENLVIFPEGTRSLSHQPVKFQRGAAYIALASKAPITTVLINCNPPMLTKKDKWYQIPYNRPHFELQFTKGSSSLSEEPAGDYLSSRARKLTRDWEALYNIGHRK